MYCIEESATLKHIMEVFRRLRMWQREGEPISYRKTALKLFYLIFYVFHVVTLFSGGILSDNWNDSVFLISGSIAVLIVAIKLFYILWKKDEICAFLQDIGTHSVEDSEEYTKVNERVKNLMKFSSWFILMISVGWVVLFTFCLPVFSHEKKLPFNIWFPLDWKNNEIAYWIAYSFVVISAIIGVVALLLNVIIWYLMMSCSIKYRILGSQFRTMFSPKPAKLEEENLFFFQEIIRLIKAHRLIKGSIDRFKLCFGNLFLAQITTSGLCICGSVYMLTFGSDRELLILRIFTVAVLFYNFFDIFMIMYLGNEIELLSDRLSYCLFESNWLEMSEPCKKCMIIFNEILQQPHKLVVGVLYQLNMETFTSIVNLAYGMFNILQNLN